MGKVFNFSGRKRDTARGLRKLQEKMQMRYLSWDYQRKQSIGRRQTMKVNVVQQVKDLAGEPILKPGTQMSRWPIERLAKWHEDMKAGKDIGIEEFKKLAEECAKMVADKSVAKDADLRFLCTEALLAVPQGENPSGEEKFKVYCMARKLSESDTVELTTEEVADIKRRAGKIFQPAVMGPMWELLEKSAQSPAPEVAPEPPQAS